jgi:hypothetical protein
LKKKRLTIKEIVDHFNKSTKERWNIHILTNFKRKEKICIFYTVKR